MIKLSTEWLSICGGCHVSILDLHEKIFTIFESVKILHSPPLTDIRGYPEADIGIVSGAIRSSLDREHANAMRKSCKNIIAFGTCAVFGGISGAGIVHSREEILNTVYTDNPSTENIENNLPSPETGLSEMEEAVVPLDNAIKINAYLTGCPPHPLYIFNVLHSLIKKKPITTNYQTVCAQCKRKMVKNKEPELTKLKRFTEGIPDDSLCFLSQGYLCFGPVTLERCRMACPDHGMVCIGCSGPSLNILKEPTRDIRTELAKLISKLTHIKEKQAIEEIEKFSKTHYAYAMASDMIRNKPTFLIDKWIRRLEEESGGENNSY
ncbi:MAG: methyl viologen-reducing hydrogenase [Desulfobacterales bacterium]|nr:methyl viologen-reducing hydrogenase [Desulfobacterales bacterium]